MNFYQTLHMLFSNIAILSRAFLVINKYTYMILHLKCVKYLNKSGL